MNARHDVSAVPSSSLAMSLAESALRLRGPDIRTFVEQFLSHASKPSIVRIAGDDKVFRQALCFPVMGKGSNDDTILPFPGVPPHLLIELGSGHVIGFRINDSTPSRLSVNAFINSIERYQDLMAKRDTRSWSGIEQMIEGTQKRRIRLFDFVLDNDPTIFWREYFPQGATRLANRALQGLPITEPGRKRVISTMSDIHTEHYRRTCADFLGRLDQERIKAIRVSGLSPQLSRYNSFQNSNANSAYRIQAAEAIPLLGYLLGAETHRAERLRHLVDDGQPLWPALADTLGVPEETVRWIRNKTADEVGDAWLGRIHTLLPDLSRLPPEKRPKNREEWTAYTDFILVLNQPDAHAARTHWLKDLARLGWLPARQKFAAMNADPADLLEVHDFVWGLTQALYYELTPEPDLPAIRHIGRLRDDDDWPALTQAVNGMFYGASILKQVRASLCWHELQLRPEDEAAEVTDATETAPDSRALSNWPAPFDGPVKLGKLYAHFLITPAQLKDEGLRMQHCVGNYDYQCLYGGANIVSFRDEGGRSVSTAELRLDERGKQLRMTVAQHKARNNSGPPPHAINALQQLLTLLNDEKRLPRLEAMREQLVQRQARAPMREHWRQIAPNAPGRMRILKAALKLHVGYERFLEVARKAIAA